MSKMYDFEAGYWDNKPMVAQLSAVATCNRICHENSNEIDIRDMEGLIKAGVRFPEIEETFKD